MPELPEVETIANGVNARVRGERIVGAWFSDKREPMKTPPAVMEGVLTGAVIESVHRVGKTVVFDLLHRDASQGKKSKASADSGRNDSSLSHAQWLVHLGMTGRLLVNDPTVEKPAHTHAVLSLASGRELRFVDPRRFGRLSIHGMEGPDLGRGGKAAAAKQKSSGPKSRNSKPGLKTTGWARKAIPGNGAVGTLTGPAPFTGSGQEPLTIGAAEFAALFRGRQTPIKAALLNQKLLHGVGNIYADEALFRAGVRPSRRSARVSRAEMERLRTGLVAVLRRAIARGGSSVSDYVDAEGSRGFFQLEHRVYQRTGEECTVCGTAIRRQTIGGRSSHFCPKCQK